MRVAWGRRLAHTPGRLLLSSESKPYLERPSVHPEWVTCSESAGASHSHLFAWLLDSHIPAGTWRAPCRLFCVCTSCRGSALVKNEMWLAASDEPMVRKGWKSHRGQWATCEAHVCWWCAPLLGHRAFWCIPGSLLPLWLQIAVQSDCNIGGMWCLWHKSTSRCRNKALQRAWLWHLWILLGPPHFGASGSKGNPRPHMERRLSIIRSRACIIERPLRSRDCRDWVAGHRNLAIERRRWKQGSGPWIPLLFQGSLDEAWQCELLSRTSLPGCDAGFRQWRGSWAHARLCHFPLQTLPGCAEKRALWFGSCPASSPVPQVSVNQSSGSVAANVEQQLRRKGENDGLVIESDWGSLVRIHCAGTKALAAHSTNARQQNVIERRPSVEWGTQRSENHHEQWSHYDPLKIEKQHAKQDIK